MTEPAIRSGVRRFFRLHLRSAERARADADAELESYIESRTEDLVLHGMTAEDARAESVWLLGNGAGIEEIRSRLRRSVAQRERKMRARDWVDELRQDVRFALRQLARAPGFTAVAVLTLALGIGATSAIFSVVYSVLLKPLPFAHADRLVSLRERNNPEDDWGMVVTAGNYGTWLARAHDFESLTAYAWGNATLTGLGEPTPVRLLRVAAGFWTALYEPPVVGRYFGIDEDRPGAPAVVVISQALWRSKFGGDPHIVGRIITLSEIPYTVIGVAPDGYELLSNGIDAWAPLALTTSQLSEHTDHEYNVYGLIRTGVSEKAAITELTAIELSLAKQYPDGFFDGGIIAQPLRASLVGSAQKLLLLLLGAVTLVLLIACGNISSLLLARAGVRETEVAVRGALGAGRGRIIRQLLAESLVLSLGGAIAGLMIAVAVLRFLLRLSPLGYVPRLNEATLNGPVLAFTLALAIGCGVLFGLYPALRTASPDLQRLLREGSLGGGGTSSSRFRDALVVAEVAVSLVLLVAAGLLLRSAIRVQAVDPGFDARNLLTVGVALPDTRYANDDADRAAWDRILSGVSAIPGVRSAAMVSRLPIADLGFDCAVRAEGAPEASKVGADTRSASDGLLATMRIPLVRGRFFDKGDVPTSPIVVVITRGLAHRLFGDADPIGRRMTDCINGAASPPTLRTIVGVIGDLHARGLDDRPRDEMYFASSQMVLEHRMALVVRGAVPVATLVPAVKRAIAEVDPLLPVSPVTMEEIIAKSLAVSRFTTLLLVVLGGMGLVLAVIGIYGVIAYFVVRQRREIGIRMALGSTPRRVVRMVVREGVVLAAIGIIIGCAVSLAVTKVLESMLYQGVSARDPATLVGVSLLIGIVAMGASVVPAWRAARVAPVEALRAQ